MEATWDLYCPYACLQNSFFILVFSFLAHEGSVEMIEKRGLEGGGGE